jgi:hypothetical protein
MLQHVISPVSFTWNKNRRDVLYRNAWAGKAWAAINDTTMSYSSSFDKAFALHQDGQPQEAVDAYLTILTAKPYNGTI